MSGARPTPADRYRRVPEFERRARSLRLRPIEWQVLLALDGIKTNGQIAQKFNLDAALVGEIIARFEALGMLETRVMTLDEYYEMAKIPVPSPAAPAPSVTGTDAPAVEAPPAEEAAPRITFSLRRGEAKPAGELEGEA